MVKKQDNVLKIDQLEENVKKQTEYAKKGYSDWLELNKRMWEQTISSYDMQIELWLSVQLAYLDLMKNMMGYRPDFKGLGKGLNPFTGHFEHMNELSSEFIEMKKKKAELMAKSLQKYHKKSVESTLEAFDKYCDLLSTA